MALGSEAGLAGCGQGKAHRDADGFQMLGMEYNTEYTSPAADRSSDPLSEWQKLLSACC